MPSEEDLAWKRYNLSCRDSGRKRKRSATTTNEQQGQQRGPKYQLFRSGVLVHMGKTPIRCLLDNFVKVGRALTAI